MRSASQKNAGSPIFGGTPLVTRGAVEIFRHDWSLDSSDAVRDLHYTMTPLDEGIRSDARVSFNRVTTTHSETARQLVHMGSGCFALLLRDLTWWQAAALACVAIAFNAAVLPLVGGRRLYRPSDHARGFPPGILIYPAAVLRADPRLSDEAGHRRRVVGHPGVR